MNIKIKSLSIALAVLTIMGTCACGKKSSDVSSKASVGYEEMTLGKDCTDIKAELKILTNRTDLIEQDTNGRDFQDYIEEFNEMYPNIKISYEGITNYDDDMTTRITSNDWGSICCIPSTVDKGDLSTYFEPIAAFDSLSKSYEFVDKNTYDNKVYGIPSTGNVQGIVYNKRVWSEAGVDELPHTPDEFIAALELIDENTDAIPMYTNYAAGWALTAWDAYINAATGDSAFKNQILPHASNPFDKRDDGAGPYAVYSVLYNAVANGLTEDDPTTTDWESSKSRINNGEIATMVLGSWAVPQMQSAGDNFDDIGYMPFPVSMGSNLYAAASADYCYGVNKYLTADEKTAAFLYIKFLTEKSNYAYDNGGIPIVKGEAYPTVLEAFEDAIILTDKPALEGEEDLYSAVNNDSELSLDADPTHIARIVEAAKTGSESFDDIMSDWNDRWTDAQERNNIEINK